MDKHTKRERERQMDKHIKRERERDRHTGRQIESERSFFPNIVFNHSTLERYPFDLKFLFFLLIHHPRLKMVFTKTFLRFS